MKTLQRVEQRRRMMLMRLAKADILKGDFKRLIGSMGYDSSKKTVDPKRFKPPTNNSQGLMQKWVQIALNVVLGVGVSVDGKIGPITRQAIKRFQRQEGIASHGYIDDRTLQVLELRTGIQAPRQITHESIPHLLMLPRRGLWKRDKKAKDQQRKGRAKPKADTQSDAPKHAEEDDVERATQGVLQTEAMGAVAELAFDKEFVDDAATELNRTDRAKLRKEMDGWFKKAGESDIDDRPSWLQRVHDLARAHAESAASTLREEWWTSLEDES